MVVVLLRVTQSFLSGSAHPLCRLDLWLSLGPRVRRSNIFIRYSRGPWEEIMMLAAGRKGLRHIEQATFLRAIPH